MSLNLNYKPVVEISGLSREEWLDYRKKGIGGSDAAAIMGVSPFATKRDLFYDKTGIRRSTNALVSWWFCVNFSIDISETAKQIIAGVFFLMVLPHEIFIHDTQRRFSRNGRVIELVEKDYEPEFMPQMLAE